MRTKKLLWVCIEPSLIVLALLSLLVGHRNLSQFSPPDSKKPSLASQSPTASANVTAAAQSRIRASFGKLPLSFEVNQGQADARVKYLARGSGYTLFLTPTEAVVSLRKELPSKHAASAHHARRAEVSTHQQPSGRAHLQFATLRIGLKGANPTPRVVGLDELPGKSNYLIGNDPANWHTQIPTYARVRYENVYPGVDLVYYGTRGQLEYDFAVAPGGDPGGIRLKFDKGSHIHLNEVGDLVINFDGADLLQQKARAYQEVGGARREIPARYIVGTNNELGFALGSYDPRKPLVIDPTLVYSARVPDPGTGLALDSASNAYLVGCHFVAGPDNCDVAVAKLNAAGSALVYSTTFGGSGYDYGNSIAVDSAGNAYVTGFTASINFPTTPGARQTGFGGPVCNTQGCFDAFVTVLNASGSGFVYSSFLGGSREDKGTGIALDPSNKVYVTGTTFSTDFPTTPGAFQTVFPTSQAGSGAAFVAKLDPTRSGLSSLVYSTYVGGSSFAEAHGITADASGHAYVTGDAGSGFPVTSGAFQTNLRGTSTGAAFVTKVSTTGASLDYSTFLGGSSTSDTGMAIAVDASGDAYVAGYAVSSDFPTTPGAFQTTLKGRDDAFVAKLNPAGSSLLYSTLLGGTSECDNGFCDEATAIALDSSGRAYVTGVTNSNDFPTTPVTLDPSCANDGTCNGSITPHSNAFVSTLNPSGSALVFSTFLGGSVCACDLIADSGAGIAIDSEGNIYVTGRADSSDFPLTPGAFVATQGIGFVTKISPTGVGPALGVSVPNPLVFPGEAVGTTSPQQAVGLTNRGNATLNISSITVTGDFAQVGSCPATLSPGASCPLDVTFTPTGLGFRLGTLTIIDDAIGSPHTLSLNGEGGTPAAQLSTASLTFPDQQPGTTSAAQTVTFSDPGNADLRISSIAATGDFGQTNNCGSNLSAGANCTISVTFSPTAFGSRTGSVTIIDNASSSPQIIALGGTGADFGFTASSSSASVMPGSSATYNLTVSPMQGFNGTVAMSCGGAPQKATCSVSPTSVSVNGTSASATVTVTTMAHSLVPPSVRSAPFDPGAAVRFRMPVLLLLLWMALTVVLAGKSRHVRTVRALTCGPALLLLLLVVSCGGGGGGTTGGGGSSGTPAGTFNLTATAKSGGISHNVKLTLIVQ